MTILSGAVSVDHDPQYLKALLQRTQNTEAADLQSLLCLVTRQTTFDQIPEASVVLQSRCIKIGPALEAEGSSSLHLFVGSTSKKARAEGSNVDKLIAQHAWHVSEPADPAQ